MRKFNFFQEVRVKETVNIKDYRGKIGAVLGVSMDGGMVFGYAVSLDGYSNVVYFKADDLEETGKYRKKSDYY